LYFVFYVLSGVYNCIFMLPFGVINDNNSCFLLTTRAQFVYRTPHTLTLFLDAYLDLTERLLGVYMVMPSPVLSLFGITYETRYTSYLPVPQPTEVRF